jgi:hypothetical protein
MMATRTVELTLEETRLCVERLDRVIDCLRRLRHYGEYESDVRIVRRLLNNLLSDAEQS